MDTFMSQIVITVEFKGSVLAKYAVSIYPTWVQFSYFYFYYVIFKGNLAEPFIFITIYIHIENIFCNTSLPPSKFLNLGKSNKFDNLYRGIALL